MAFHDILQALESSVSSQRSVAVERHQAALSTLRSTFDKEVASAIDAVQEAGEHERARIHAQTLARANAERQQAIMLDRSMILQRTFDKALEALLSLPEDKSKAFLAACIECIGDVEGIVHPAPSSEKILSGLLRGTKLRMGEPLSHSKGGFRFVSSTFDKDCTYEFLVHEVLRPATELTVSRTLFPSS